MQSYDILVVGAGLGGGLMALSLGRQGRHIALIDPRPSFEPSQIVDEGRSTAVMQHGLELLDQLCLLQGLTDRSEALWRLRLIDAKAAAYKTPEIITFDARETGDKPFALNIPNALLLRAIYLELSKLENVTLYPSEKVKDLNSSQVELESGQILDAKIIIGADGKNSKIRTLAGIQVRTQDFDQVTHTLVVSHTLEHNQTSTELHYFEGPLTFVPMLGNRSAVVWSETSAVAHALAEKGEAAQLERMQSKSHGLLGKLSLDLKPFSVHQTPKLARQLVQGRVALIAEAAHALPPIGAQGLNTSMADVRALSALLETGSLEGDYDAVLKAYDRQRRIDARLRFEATNAFNHITGSNFSLAQSFHQLGIKALNAMPPLRQLMMKVGARPFQFGATRTSWN